MLRKVMQSQVFDIHFGTEALAGIKQGSVAGASTNVPGYGTLRLGCRQAGGLALRFREAFAKSGVQCHGHAGRAKSALGSVEPRHALVDGVVVGLLRAQTLRGGDGAAVEGAEQRQARIHRHFADLLGARVVSAHEHHACAASSFAAPALGAAQGSLRAEVREEREGGIHLRKLHAHAIQSEYEWQARGSRHRL